MNVSWREISPGRIARTVAVISTLLAIGLHVVFGMQVGALWRDEVNSLELATVRTLSEMWMQSRLRFVSGAFFSGAARPSRESRRR